MTQPYVLMGIRVRIDTINSTQEREQIMQGLEQIITQNARASESIIGQLQNDGKHVAAVYVGLNFHQAKGFDTSDQAQAWGQSQLNSLVGSHVKYHAPWAAVA